MKKETVVIQKEMFSSDKSKIAKYQDLIIGDRSWRRLMVYEFIIGLCSWMPGALGLLLRSKLYPLLFKKVGTNVNFGIDIAIRHPGKITIGDNVVIDDHCVLDAKGTDNRGIVIGNGVFLGRNSILSCKNGDIVLGDNVNIGFNSEVFSASRVTLERNALVAAYCYFIGGDHDFQSADVSVLDQSRSSRGITIGEGVWLGAGVKVLDGIRIAEHSIIGANAVVNRDIPAYSIAVGVPAKVIRKRK